MPPPASSFGQNHAPFARRPAGVEFTLTILLEKSGRAGRRLQGVPAFMVYPTLALLALTAATALASDADWRHYLGGPDRSHYSTLAQITRENVSQLEVAWTFHTGDAGEMQCNPIVVDGVLYGATASNQIFAVDAATGRELWRYTEKSGEWTKTVRGVTYWTDGREARILFTLASQLCAVDARTGRLVEGFGTGGKADLRQGLGAGSENKWVVSSTPGTLFGNLYIVPTRVSEEAGAAPGSIQAFYVRTGKLAWVFHTIPQPGSYGHDTWPKGAAGHPRLGGANSWAGMTLDEKRGILYVPTGSASPDFWGGDRPGSNLFANCLIALDAATGRRLWHYQTVHHDLWDRDLPAPPVLLDVRRDGKVIPAVAQTTKHGYVFVFNRLTGEPLFPIDEKPFPAATLPGQTTWPTQPIPRLPAPYARQVLTEDDIRKDAPDAEQLLALFRGARHGMFEPFGTDTVLLFPGFDGGAEWGGPAVDPDGTLYVNSSNMAWLVRLVQTPTETQLAGLTPGERLYALQCAGCHGADRSGNPASGFPSLIDITQRRDRPYLLGLISGGKGMMPGFGHLSAPEKEALLGFLGGSETVTATGGETAPSAPAADPAYKLDGYIKFLSSDGYPGVTPPWGHLSAIDLNTGDYKWKITLGEYPELKARGIPQTGAENYGGPIVTASGVLFIGATRDGMFRAFDTRDGRLLWETELPAPAFATPTTYQLNGRQYIVIACGGTKLNTRSGDAYVAFALPASP